MEKKKFLNKKTIYENPLDKFVIKKKKIENGSVQSVINNNSDNKTEHKLSDDSDKNFSSRIPREFYMTECVNLARNLLGKIIIRKINNVYVECRIVETEAYVGPLDKGAHCYNNKKTDRTKYFWNIGGSLYVYMIHNHNCLNIVSNEADKPEAVLIRSIEPLKGIETIKEIRGDSSLTTLKNIINLVNGPGKVGKALNIDRSHNAVDLCHSKEIFLIDDPDFKFEIDRSTRININYAEEYKYKPWRFYIKNNPFVSKVKIEHQYIDD
jgi:DNA-3-methyladenine glycosylase